jgi:outer membrane protein assembly factor BamB
MDIMGLGKPRSSCVVSVWRSRRLFCLGLLSGVYFGLLAANAAFAVNAADWPCWGYDRSRQGASPEIEKLPENLSLLWQRTLPSPQRAWLTQKDDRDKLEFDLSYAPVAARGKLFIASMRDDSLTAYDLKQGQQIWKFYADGPMRVAPSVAGDKIYAVSDDGHLYCLNADSGEFLWRFFAAPGPHLVLGNRRLISLWPARGAPLVADGVLYFAAGIWPFLGTCVYALDAEHGEVLWANTGHSTQWQAQPHGGAYAFSGLAPQGYLALTADRLVVAGGRSLPALFNSKTGELIHYNAQAKPAGGYKVMVDDQFYYNHGLKYHVSSGHAAGRGEVENKYREQLRERSEKLREQLDGDIFESIVADGKLIISTLQGGLYCFGTSDAPSRQYPWQATSLQESHCADSELAQQLLAELGVKAGWALIPGGASREFLEALLLHSELNLVVLEEDPEIRWTLREHFAAAGLYGERLSLQPGKLLSLHYPEYISSLILVPHPEKAGINADVADLKSCYQLLRPYFGRAWINFPAAELRAGFGERLRHRWRIWRGKSTVSLAQARFADFAPEDGHLELADQGVILARTSALPGSGQWTHQHANAAQSVLSEDQLVKPPFAPIWFGTIANSHVLPRHHYGPRPQVAGGVLAILGVETLSARCVYTGRSLWVKEFPGIGHAFTSLELEAKWQAGEQIYMINEPGATYIGSPFVTMPDSVYLRYKGKVYRFHSFDGSVLGEWKLPALIGEAEDPDLPDWGHISVQGDCLIVSSNPYIFHEGRLGKKADGWDGSASRRLIVMNRFSGEKLWHRDAQIGFRHNAICSTSDRIFVNDLLSASALDKALRRGLPIEERPRLYALDLLSGKELWSVESDVFGTFLCYSDRYKILLEGGTRDSRSHLADEPTDRLQARSGEDGSVLWKREENYSGPLIIHDDMVIAGRPGPGFDLHNGENKTRRHPLTDAEVPWRYWKSYGCGSSNAGTHLLLFRSGAAGFADLEHDGGTGNIGGFKSGCTSSMIPADGILNAPDYTRTCTCSYQNQTSLGLVYRPEMEIWSSNQTIQQVDGAIRQVGLNFGAPGDRRASNSTLWLHVPRLAPSPMLNVLLECGEQQAGVRITQVSGRGRPEDVLDGIRDSSWLIQDNRKGSFAHAGALTLKLNETVTLDSWHMAWRAPKGSEVIVERRQGEDWELVFQIKGEGKGREMLSYSFPACSSDSWRLRFAQHEGDNTNPRGGQLALTAKVYDLRLGDLQDSAYAYFTPKNYWRTHALSVHEPGGLDWVAASGIKDIRKVLLPAQFDPQADYELTLIFAEPEHAQAGRRVFDVLVQGEPVARGVDPYASSGGLHRGQRLLCSGLKLQDCLQVEFVPQDPASEGAILCGLELRQKP